MSDDNKKSIISLTGSDNKLNGKDAGAENQSGDEEYVKSAERQIKLTLRDYNLIYAIPFFCTIATRLPLIYFVIELRDTFDESMSMIGLFIGAFHLCRVISIAGSIISPKLLQLLGCIVGLAGFSSLLFLDNTNFTVFVLGNIVTGFAEGSSHVFVYSKQQYGTDLPKLRMAIRTQSTFIGIAVILGFFFGGMAFHMFGVHGIAVAGMIVLVLEVASLLYFLTCPPNANVSNDSSKERTMKRASSKRAPSHEAGIDFSRVVQEDDIEDEGSRAASHKLDTISQEEKDNDNIDGDNGDIRGTDSAEENRFEDFVGGIQEIYANHEEIVPHSFTYLIAAMFSVEAIATGYLFSIGPLFMCHAFDINQGLIGTLFSLASLFGSVFTVLAISPKGRALQKRYLRSPYNLYILIAIMTIALFGMTIPSFPVHVICIMLLIGGSELFLTLLSELQGAITTSHYYDVLGPSAQMIRRILNIIMAVSGPSAYHVLPLLPYIMAGFLCTVYTLVFVYLTERHQKENAELFEKVSKEKFYRLSLPSMEVMARMVSFRLKSAPDSNVKKP